MNRKHFTLTELLMAIGIIVILAALAIPTSISAIKKAERTKAQSEMTTLLEALKNYETTYGVIPVKQLLGANNDGEVPRAKNEDNETAQESDTYTKLIKILQGENMELSGKKLNPRKIKFLDVQENTEGAYLDPWGYKYHIVLDGNYDGKIDLTGGDKIPGLGDGSSLHQSIIIWSDGPDGDKDEVSDNLYSLPVLWDKDTEVWQPETH